MHRFVPVPARSVVVARGDVRRTVRAIAESPRQLIATGLTALLFGAFALAATAGAFFAGREARSGDLLADVAVTSVARGALGLLWVALVAFVAFRTVTTVADLETPPLELTALSVRDVAIGLGLAETVRIGCWVAPPLALVTLAFAAGALAPFAALSVPIVAVLVWVAALPPGFTLGIAVKHALTRYEPLARIKTPLVALLFLAYFGLLVTGRASTLARALFDPVQHWPVSWLADALLLSVPGLSGSPAFAAGGVVGALAVGALAWPVAVVLASRYWLSEPVRTSAGAETASRAGSSVLERAFVPVTTRRTRAVATVVWRRTYRAPAQLLFVAYPLFFMIAPAQDAVESLLATGTIPAVIPPLVMAYAVWAAGMAFTLNPLGDLGATLPATLSAPRTGPAVVRGRVVVANFLALPLSVAFVGTVAGLSTVSPAVAVVLVLATALGVVAATLLATGIGVAFPRFGAVSVTRNREAVIPSKTAAVGYSVAVLVLAAALALVAYRPAWEPVAAIVSALVSFVGPLEVDVPVIVVRPVGALALAPLAVVPWFSYRYAVRTVSDYRLE